MFAILYPKGGPNGYWELVTIGVDGGNCSWGNGYCWEMFGV